MGEEVKRPEDEKKAEDEKPKEAQPEEPPAEAAPPPPPPEEVEIRVFMHCEGCARKVRRCLRGLDGVEDVRTDCRTHKVVVKGKAAAADPLKVVDRVEKKTGRKVELLTPLPLPPKEVEEKKEEDKPKVEEEKKDEPVVMEVVLRVHMHCEACAQEIKKRILKMKGVQSAEPEHKASQVTVKGTIEPAELVEHVRKRTGKHAAIVKAEPEKPPEEETIKKPEEVEKPDGEKGGGGGAGDEKEKKEEATETVETVAAAVAGGGGKVEQRRNEYYYYYPRHQVEHAYAPQIFSDENPNACSVM